MSKIRNKSNFENTEKFGPNLKNVDILSDKDLTMIRTQSQDTEMSIKTKSFIQKLCYRTGATIDMTRHGFVNDSKLHPINLLMKPLQKKIESICGKPVIEEPESKISEPRRMPVRRAKRRVRKSTSSSLSPSFERRSSHGHGIRSRLITLKPPPPKWSPENPCTPTNSPRDTSPKPILQVSGLNSANARMRRCIIRKRVRLVLPITEASEKKTRMKKSATKNKKK